MEHKRSKPQKVAIKCKNMRRAKAVKRVIESEEERILDAAEAAGYQWTDNLIEQCSAAADRLLRFSRTHADLRARTWKKETPVGFAVDHLCPAVMMCP